MNNPFIVVTVDGKRAIVNVLSISYVNDHEIHLNNGDIIHVKEDFSKIQDSIWTRTSKWGSSIHTF